MGRAIEKLSRIGRIARALPGRDCGVCGAPSCAGLAEDIVLGRARPEDCPFDNGGSAADEPGGPAAAGPGEGRQEPAPGGQP
jgi:Na+-translocating ferredoxin:NAD+ oxidoreductase RNF subunit RnfB